MLHVVTNRKKILFAEMFPFVFVKLPLDQMLILFALLISNSFSSEADVTDNPIENGGFFSLNLSPQKFENVPFGYSSLSVWKHVTDSRYFVRPLAVILGDSTKIQLNKLSRSYELNFNVLLWSREAQECVYHYLLNRGHMITGVADVEPMPIEKIRITWSDPQVNKNPNYELGDKWKSVANLPNEIKFKIVCKTRKFCSILLEELRKEAELLEMFEIEYTVGGRKTSAREISVHGSHFDNGKMFTRVANWQNMGMKIVNWDVVKKISSETVRNIVNEATTDAISYVSVHEITRFNKLIQKVLTKTVDFSEKFNDAKWDHVFWDPVSERPDLAVKDLLNEIGQLAQTTLNKSFASLDYSDIQRLGAKFGVQEQYLLVMPINGTLMKDIIGINSTFNTDFSRKHRKKMTELIEKLKQISVSRQQKIIPKPIDLYRIDTENLKNTVEVFKDIIEINYYQKVYSTQLSILHKGRNTQRISNTNVDFLIRNQLTDQLENPYFEVISEINKKANELNEQIDYNISNFTTKIETKLEANQNATKENLTNHINSWDGKGAKLSEEIQHLESSPLWPKGSYCVWTVFYLAENCAHLGGSFKRLSYNIWTTSFKDARTTNRIIADPGSIADVNLKGKEISGDTKFSLEWSLCCSF